MQQVKNEMKKTFSFVAVLLMAAFLSVGANAQTYKYKLVKIVNRENGAEYNPHVDVRYITFSGNSFRFTNQNGQPITRPENAYIGSWSFCNIEYSTYNNGLGGSISSPTGGVINPRVFNFVGMENGNKKYHNRRTVCSQQTNKVVGYIDDYILFSADLSRFNIYSGGSEQENGLGYGGSSVQLCGSNQIYVYERVDSSPGGGVLY